MSRLLPFVLLLAVGIAAAQDTGHVRHPLLAAQPASEADGASLLVEITAGSAIKYEVDADGHLFVDRFLSMPRWRTRPTTARCRARSPATAIRWTRWC